MKLKNSLVDFHRFSTINSAPSETIVMVMMMMMMTTATMMMFILMVDNDNDNDVELADFISLIYNNFK